MRITAYDSETALIRPGMQCPEMACITWQTLSDRAPNTPAEIRHAKEAENLLATWLTDKDRTITGAHTAFDMGVACANFPALVDLVFAAYDADRITDVQIRAKLIDVAAGRYQGFHTDDGGWFKPRYDLENVARRWGGVHLDKPAQIVAPDGKKISDPKHARLRFGELIPFPVEVWDELALERGFHGPPPTVYAKEDSVATLAAHVAQGIPGNVRYLKLEYEYARRAFALYLWSAWGVRTDPKRVARLAALTEQERDRLGTILQEYGFVRANGTRDTKAAAAYMRKVCRESGLRVPLTKTGVDKDKTRGMSREEIEAKYTALSEDACDATEDPLLEAYADFTRLGTVLNKDCAALAKGTLFPIHTRNDIAATGRSTSSNPNMQNWGRGVGPRECFVPRPGKVFVQADYEALELRTLAQVCVKLFGHSALADSLNAGKDPHLQMAASMLGITYDEAKRRRKTKDQIVEDARQAGKVANFGYPGGLGAAKLVVWARKAYGVILAERCTPNEPCRVDKPCAVHLKEMWLASLPEMPKYFEYVNRLCANPSGMAFVEVPLSGWTRGGAPYCAACNTGFQNLGAAAAARGIWYLTKACYVDRGSVLFGSRGVNHIHDENFGEVDDDDTAHDKAVEWERLMVKGANELLPDVPATAPPMLMRYWSKEAFALTNARKRLVPWGGEWICECGGVFQGPSPAEKKCSQHTSKWLQAA